MRPKSQFKIISFVIINRRLLTEARLITNVFALTNLACSKCGINGVDAIDDGRQMLTFSTIGLTINLIQKFSANKFIFSNLLLCSLA